VVIALMISATRLFALMQPVTRCISIVQNYSAAGDQECRELDNCESAVDPTFAVYIHIS